ncbi:NUDIX hydrolase [Yunchengibacter salinarum]|uniref:NUDIX hydrolase n=1 Tax=Yunchengibacter salinarum TaxID=3133399 RepID=UPI0035B6AB13
MSAPDPDTAPPRVAVGALVVRERQVLMIKRGRPPRQGEWSIPGGKQEWGETVRETLVREVREETGLTVTPGALVDVLDLMVHDDAGTLSHHLTLLDYLAHPVDDRAPEAGDDAAEARFIPFAEAIRLADWHETRRVIARAAELSGHPMPEEQT